MKGVVVFMTSEKGSKSEGVYPYLYTGNGEFVRIYKEGDNPFENRTFKKYDGQRVELEGEFNENEWYVVSGISRSQSCEKKAEGEEEEAEEYPLVADEDEEVDKAFTLSPEEEESEEFALVPDKEEEK